MSSEEESSVPGAEAHRMTEPTDEPTERPFTALEQRLLEDMLTDGRSGEDIADVLGRSHLTVWLRIARTRREAPTLMLGPHTVLRVNLPDEDKSK